MRDTDTAILSVPQILVFYWNDSTYGQFLHHTIANHSIKHRRTKFRRGHLRGPWGIKYRWSIKISQFLTSRYISQMIQDSDIVTTEGKGEALEFRMVPVWMTLSHH